MTQFGQVLKANSGPGSGQGFEHYYRFINQFLKIPTAIFNKVNADYASEPNESVRYCIALILANLAKYGAVAYSRSDDYYAEHGGGFYTYTYMLKAVDDYIVMDKYAISKKGSKNQQYQQGIASSLRPLDKIYQINISFKDEIDRKRFPLIEFAFTTKTTVPRKNGIGTKIKKSKEKNDIYTKWELNKYLRTQQPLYTLPPSTPSITSTTSTTSLTSNTSIISTTSSTSSESINTLSRTHNIGWYAQLFQDSQTLNRKYFSKVTLDFANLTTLRFKPLAQVFLTRIFSNDECGRWYQKGSLSYQQLNKQERLKVLINGDEVAEWDYSAMHPHILYAWEGHQCPDDFYERIAMVLGIPYDDTTKPAVKGVTLMSINATEKNLKKAIDDDSRKERNSNFNRVNEGRDPHPVINDELAKLKIDFITIVNAFRSAHPTIAKYIYSNSPNKLMLEESEIMTSVLLELMKKKILAIPIHDSVLFPKQHAVDVKRVMLDCYQKETGFNIRVK